MIITRDIASAMKMESRQQKVSECNEMKEKVNGVSRKIKKRST